MSIRIGYRGIVRFRRNRNMRGTVGGRPVYGYSSRGMRYGARGGRWVNIVSKAHLNSFGI